MTPRFRFMVCCRKAEPVFSDATTLCDVLDSLEAPPDALPAHTTIDVAVGIFADAPTLMEMGLTAVRLDRQGEPHPLQATGAGELRGEVPAGPSVCIRTIDLLIPGPGRYAIRLFDQSNGVGGDGLTSGQLLAEHLFEVEIGPQIEDTNGQGPQWH